jgi:FAD/FMN-containing dehydrogenase/Fe-S oxidoreductase
VNQTSTARADRADTSALARTLRRELEGEVLFDALSRGRYSTDASMYQVLPLGVVIPRNAEDVRRAMQIAGEASVPLLPRGAGTSQAGQTVGEALVIDASKHLTALTAFDADARSVTVEPGLVLDALNRELAPHGLFFPVDVSTSSRATIGGMAGNNSVGARSLRYGHMVDNVIGIDAVLADGEQMRFDAAAFRAPANGRLRKLAVAMTALYEREREELASRLPKVARNVAGFNLDRLGRETRNLADILVGSEGSLAWFEQIELRLKPLPAHKVLGICHFPTFLSAMEAAQHLVTLEPTVIELVDSTVMDLARQQRDFNATLERFVRGRPAALFLIEFAGDSAADNLRRLDNLDELMATLGYPDAVVRAEEPGAQRAIWNLRKAALNIVMSAKGDGKPISFIEDCAVPLDKLGEYTTRLTDIFSRHGTTGTWYAHAAVGCLHVRPILNLKLDTDRKKLRVIADAAHALVREYKGSHSGEHGDGIARSEFIEPMLGPRIAQAYAEIKRAFDPSDRLNPHKIVAPLRMDDRALLRYPENYAPLPIAESLDWSDWGGFYRAAEMCNNNGACRKRDPGVMCPSYRATGDEQHVTRGRANSLRLALTGQLDTGALTSDALYDTMALCVGCKGCKRECPTGVDMYRMKIEFLSQYRKAHRPSLRDRLVAFLPRYAPWAARIPWALNLPNRSGFLRRLRERSLGFTARRATPEWRGDWYRPEASGPAGGREVVLLADTFNTYFQPETARAAARVLAAAGYRVIAARAADGRRPLCCGRTFLSVGLVDEAKREARRTIDTLLPYVERGVPIVGLEPSCLLTLRDEFLAMFPDDGARALAGRAFLFEEFLAAEHRDGNLRLALKALPQRRVLLHGHCHQKAFAAVPAVETVLRLIPDIELETIESSCCGMAGSFGYDAEHYDVSMRMAEQSLLPRLRAESGDTLIAADGFSCRHQISDGAQRTGVHVACILDSALDTR